MPFMPWQFQCAQVAGEIDPETNRLAYREVRVTVPRQSGKTTMVLALVLHRALAPYWFRQQAGYIGRPAQRIVYGAQTGKDARSKWEQDWLPILNESRFKGFYRPRFVNGSEGLWFVNGSIQGLIAGTESSGHGGTLDLAIDDECFARKDARREQAVLPAMNTRPEPQLWLISTAGTPKDSPYLYTKVKQGRELAEQQMDDPSARRGICYLEYSAPEDADPFDPRVWWDCMPALGYTTAEATVKSAMDTMLADPALGLSEFKRAYLNQWVLVMGEPIVPMALWDSLGLAEAPRPPWVVLGLDVNVEDGSAALVACGEVAEGGYLQTTVVESGEGVDWLLGDHGALAGAVETFDHPYVVVDGKMCAHLLPEIERLAGYDRVTTRTGTELATTFAFWRRVVTQKRLRHRGEEELTLALAGAEQRRLGDGWTLSREKSGADITPLVAQALAASFWLGSWGDDA